MPKPPERENKTLTWPDWPMKLRTSSSHEEGCERDWAVLTKNAVGSNGRIDALECVRIDWVRGADSRQQMREIAGSEFRLKRTEERRVGKEWVNTCRTRRTPRNAKNKK